MRTVALALVLLCCACGLRAENVSLEGRWKMTNPDDPAYSGDLIIDADGRAIATGSSGSRRGTWIGYVESSGPNVSLLLTDHKVVWRTRCTRPSRDVLNCDNASTDGSLVSRMYYMQRAAER